MRRLAVLQHEFVEYIPDHLRNGTIYVSIAFATAVHKCCCGCGNEVITPLSPTDWELIFDGESISLEPSIGNWSFPCRSHYWIRRNKVIWAPQWSQDEINAGRAHDLLAKKRYFEGTTNPALNDTRSGGATTREIRPKESLWSKLKKWLS